MSRKIPLTIKIKRFDSSLPLPEYKTEGAAAFDLSARITTTIQPGEIMRIPLNVALKIPETHFVLLAARSSLHKRGLTPANGIGIGDADYCGDNDEYQAAIHNVSNKPVTVEKGERIFQALILERQQIIFEEVEQLGQEDRGGFGSTGRK